MCSWRGKKQQVQVQGKAEGGRALPGPRVRGSRTQLHTRGWLTSWASCHTPGITSPPCPHRAHEGCFVWRWGRETPHREMKVSDLEKGPGSRRQVPRKWKWDKGTSDERSKGTGRSRGRQRWEVSGSQPGGWVARGTMTAVPQPSEAHGLPWAATVASSPVRTVYLDFISPGLGA